MLLAYQGVSPSLPTLSSLTLATKAGGYSLPILLDSKDDSSVHRLRLCVTTPSYTFISEASALKVPPLDV